MICGLNIILISFFAFFSTVFLTEDPEITELRSLLTNSVDNKDNGQKFWDKIGHYSGDNAIFLAYKAAAHAVKASYSTNPLKKKKMIKTSAAIFSDAVARDNQNVEIRYIRFVVETKTPAKVKLSQHLEEDKKILVQAIQDYPKSGIEREVVLIARDFIRANCVCTEEEMKILNEAKLN